MAIAAALGFVAPVLAQTPRTGTDKSGQPAADAKTTGKAGGKPVVDVAIESYEFRPAELKVRVGTTVRWTNREKRTSHSVLWLGPKGFESDRLFPDESYQRTFERAGRYEYSCGPHPRMSGVVIVTD